MSDEIDLEFLEFDLPPVERRTYYPEKVVNDLKAEIKRWREAAATVVRQWDGKVANGSEIEDGIEELRSLLEQAS